MYQYIRKLSAVSQRSVVPRLSARCHSSSRSNSPSYTPLLDLVKMRQKQAQSSVLVQVAGPNSALDLLSYCHEQFGEVQSLHYFNNKSSHNFNHFFIVSFIQVKTVNKILNSAQHSTGDGMSSTPVPVYSPFLWLQEGKVSKNINKFKNVPVDYGPGVISEQKVKTMSDVSEQMYQLWRLTDMTDTALRLRFLVCRQLELAIAGMFPHAQVLPFGSAINGFGTCESDQDMVLDLDNPDNDRRNRSRLVFQAKGAVYGGDRAQVQRHCEELANIIQSFLPGCQDVQKILNARVPIIKYSHELVGLDCDLSMSSSSGLHMSCLLHLWGDMDWRVRPLVATVRRWARSVGLVKEMRPTQYFTNFTLTMLVVCYLQKLGMLPAYTQLAERATEKDSFTTRDGVNVNFLHNINNQKELLNKCYHSDISLFDLLHGFFSQYATYDFSKNVLCPITGTDQMKTKQWKHSSHLDMINPLEPDLNVSYNVSAKGLEQFKNECRKSIKKLNILKQAESEESSVKDGIFCIFKNENALPPRSRIVIPNMHEICSDDGRKNKKKPRNDRDGKSHSLPHLSVKEYFDKTISPNDAMPRLRKDDPDKMAVSQTGNEKKNQMVEESSTHVNVVSNSNGITNEMESEIWSEIEKLNAVQEDSTNKSNSTKLLSRVNISSLFIPNQDDRPKETQEIHADVVQLQDKKRVEQLKMKYLRKNSADFKHNL